MSPDLETLGDDIKLAVDRGIAIVGAAQHDLDIAVMLVGHQRRRVGDIGVADVSAISSGVWAVEMIIDGLLRLILHFQVERGIHIES